MTSDFSFNNLNISSFRAVIDKLPMFTYKLKSMDTPSITLNSVPIPSPMQRMNVPGDTVEYSSLTFSFLIDENLYNYQSILNWINGLGFPNSFDEFKEFIANDTAVGKRTYVQKETSDITIILLTNHSNPNMTIKLYNAFPTSLSGISLNNSNSESETIEATVEFSFTGFKFIN